MSIAIGLKFNGGIVFGADTQETVGDYAKKSVPKLRLEPRQQLGSESGEELMIGIAGATEDGAFMDKLVEHIWLEVSASVSFDEACEEAEKAIRSFHKEYGRIYQPGFLPRVELVYGIKMHGKSKLFKADRAAVNEQSLYHAVGIGQYLADFLTSKIRLEKLGPYQMMLLVVYVVLQCKQYIQGCGGDTHIGVLLDSGKSLVLDPWKVEFLAKLAKVADSRVAQFFDSIPSLSLVECESNIEQAMIGNDIPALMEQARQLEQKFGEVFERMLGGG